MNSDWFVIPSPKVNPTLRLICFPYAGGSAANYQPWSIKLPDFVELVIVQPPGRASRLLEPAISTMPEMVDALLPFKKELTSCPYILLGHSLGSRVAFQFALDVIRLGERHPSTLSLLEVVHRIHQNSASASVIYQTMYFYKKLKL